MAPPPSVTREATQSFCAPPDTRALFAVLGVVTHEKSGFRHSIRRAWLPSPEAGVVTRLVMRGFNASAAVIDEAAQFGDIIFLPSSASLSEYVGPLQSTWQWLECASSAWPRAALIGKAEDDVWVHLPGVLESLRAGSEALGKLNLRSLYWGVIETCNLKPVEMTAALGDGSAPRPSPAAASGQGAPSASWAAAPAPLKPPASPPKALPRLQIGAPTR